MLLSCRDTATTEGVLVPLASPILSAYELQAHLTDLKTEPRRVGSLLPLDNDYLEREREKSILKSNQEDLTDLRAVRQRNDVLRGSDSGPDHKN